MNDILEFRDEYRWLSNFWLCNISYEGLVFNSVEAAYVAAKTKDLSTRLEISKLPTPGECKRFGRQIKLRDDWENIKVEVMKHLLRQKFAPGTALSRKLKATGNCLIQEGNYWGDVFWGVCHGQGQNVLGELLMEIRSELP